MHAPTDLYVVVDRSGSMSPLAATVVAEVNRLVAAVAADDPRATVTVVAFDSDEPFDVVVDRAHAATGVLDPSEYLPGGGTPLFDAVAATLSLASRNRRADVDHREVLVAIVTDGEDNNSRATALDVLGKVRRRKAAGWSFLYLGVGDVFGDAARIGLDAGEVHPWTTDEQGIRAAFATITATALGRPIQDRPRPHRI